MIGLKFCGLTREDDVREAAAVGATHIGVILASGPRLLRVSRAAEVVAAAPAGVRRVGVFGLQTPGEVATIVHEAALDIAQLHADPTPAQVEAVRAAGVGEVWGVIRVRGADVPPDAARLAQVADAIVLDAKVDGRLGGSGVALPWAAVAEALAPWRAGRRIVLAGGLAPTTVAAAIRALGPSIVDVSSGVESAPGIKHHGLMREFADAARATVS